MSSDTDRLEFRFLWNASEHRRLYRVLQRETRRGSKLWVILYVWLALIGALSLLAVAGTREGESVVSAATPLVMVAAFFLLDRWGVAYMSARTYARDHAPCLPNDQVRVLTPDGISAHCTTSDVSVRWTGIVKVRETPEFFLFFTTLACAIQLPKRAVGDVEHLRAWLKTRVPPIQSLSHA